MPNDWCDGFLKLVKQGEAVAGESQDTDFPGYIELISFSFGSSAKFEDEEVEIGASGTGGVTMPLGHSAPRSGVQLMKSASDKPAKAGKEPMTVHDAEACQFEITKLLDLSSPDLLRAYCSTHDLAQRDEFDTGSVSFRKAVGNKRSTYLTFSFTNLVISSYALNIDGEGAATETIGISFSSCQMQYRQQAADGTLNPALSAGWDFDAQDSC